MLTFGLQLETTAAPERLFGLLSDAAGWPAWFAPCRRAEWASAGVRRVTIGPLRVDERVLEEQPPVHHAYSIVSTIPVVDHRADVWLHPTPAGTRVEWTTAFRPRFPGTGLLLRGALRIGVVRLAAALVRAGEATPP